MKPCTKQTLKLPEYPEITLQLPTHFELLYYDSLHYDAIVCKNIGKVCSAPPTITVDYFYDFTHSVIKLSILQL